MRPDDYAEAQRRIRAIRELIARDFGPGGVTGGMTTTRRGRVRFPHERDWTAPFLDPFVREALEGKHQVVRVVRWYPLDEHVYVAQLSTGAVALAALEHDEDGTPRVAIEMARRLGPEDRMPS